MHKTTAHNLLRVDLAFQSLMRGEIAIDKFQEMVFTTVQSLTSDTDSRIEKILKALDAELEEIQYFSSQSEWADRISMAYSTYKVGISAVEPLVDNELARKYGDLWTTNAKDYILLRNEDEKADLTKYVIYNTLRQDIEWIDDPGDLELVVFQMKAVGVKERSTAGPDPESCAQAQ